MITGRKSIRLGQKAAGKHFEDAFKVGRVDKIRKILDKEDFEMNGPLNQFGQTALMVASEYGHREVVKLLLERGSNPCTASKAARTALHAAAQQGHVDLCLLLLQWGASASAEDVDGWTPLHDGGVQGHAGVLDALLQRGGDPNAPAKDGRTPLHCAASSSSAESVVLLLDHGAVVNAFTGMGRTPVSFAAESGKSEIVEELLKAGGDANAADSEGVTPLHWAAQNGHERIVLLLTQNGADVNAQDKQGWSVLHYAACHGHGAIVERLLSLGANPNAVDQENQWTPLVNAVVNVHVHVVRELLARGSDPNKGSSRGSTPLHFAAHRGQVEIVRILLSAGAIPAPDSRPDLTPLLISQRRGHGQVRQLLEAAHPAASPALKPPRKDSNGTKRPRSNGEEEGGGGGGEEEGSEEEVAAWKVQVEELLKGSRSLGNGIVCDAHAATAAGVDVIVKRLRSDASQMEASVFLEDLNQLVRLKHPNLLQIFSVSQTPPAFVAESADGGSLAKMLQRAKGKLPFPCSLDLAHQISCGMQYLHQYGVLHRDLRAANIMLTRGLVAKISDFGLARARDSIHMRTNSSGTVTHLAPEAFEGVFSRKTDIFAFGVTMWEIFSQDQPFATFVTPVAIIKQIVSGSRPDVSVFADKELQQLVAKLWAPSPTDRPEFAVVQPHLETFRRANPSSKKQLRDLEDILDEAAV